MRIRVVIAASAMLFATANSRAEASEVCILKQPNHLSRIPRLVIQENTNPSRSRGDLGDLEGPDTSIIVDIDIVATGAEEPIHICAP